MQMLLQHPYLVLWLNIPVLMGLALIGRGTHLDIQWHVSYIVLVTWHLAVAGSLLSACIGLIYWLGSDRHWHQLLTTIHVLFTSCTLILFILIGLLYRKLSSSSRVGFRRLNRFLKVLVYSFLLGQLALMLNLIVGQN